MRLLPCVHALFLLCVFGVSPLRSQQSPEIQALWDELSAHWTANHLPEAEKTTGKLIEALSPSARDFTLGIQLNSALHNRASLRYNLGDYAGAEADLRHSVEQARQIELIPGLPPQAAPQLQAMIDERLRLSLRGLTNFYLAAGDIQRATEAFEEAAAIPPLWKRQAASGQSVGYHMGEVSSMEGSFYRATGDYAKATEAIVSLLEDMEEAWEGFLKSIGGVENEFSNSVKMVNLQGRSHLLMELAEVASLREQHEEAVGFVEKARQASLEMLGLYEKWAEEMRRPDSGMDPEVVRKSMENIQIGANYLLYERAALVLRAAGQERAALELMQEGLARRGEDFTPQRHLVLEHNVIRPEESLRMLGDLQALLGEHAAAEDSYAKAIALTRQHYPEGHPAILDIEESRALLAKAKGDVEGARTLAERVRQGRFEDLAEVLAFADEPMRLAYRSSIDLWSLHASLDAVEALAEVVLRTKGIVLESLLEDRGLAARVNDPQLAQTIEELSLRRRELMEALLAGGENQASRVPSLKERIAQLEGQLREGAGEVGERSRTRQALETRVADVVAALPEGGVLVEFIRYRDYSAPGRFVPRYGALVLKAGAAPAFVPLDTAATIERGMQLYAQAVRAEVEEAELRSFLEALGQSVWDPLRPHLPEPGKMLILSPDGDLNFLSFATLLAPDGRFVGEVWPLAYVSSGRDLRRGESATRRESFEVLANPDFQSPTDPTPAGSSPRGGQAALSMRGVLDRIGLSPLPGTVAEEAALREIVTSAPWGWTFSSHLGAEATEEAVSQIRGPGVLHLATHGFYLPRTGRRDPLQRAKSYWLAAEEKGRGPSLENFSDVVLDNPMHRSGIALSGAEATLKAWGAGKIPDTSRDGILTAEEMTRLDLSGTWLVVLSACETGLGEARSGEGVLGMRRGLIEAGAAHLLLTLWPVADRETALYMRDFYAGLEGGRKSPVEVAAQVQANFLKQLREDRGIGEAIRLAGPFILSFRR